MNVIRFQFSEHPDPVATALGTDTDPIAIAPVSDEEIK